MQYSNDTSQDILEASLIQAFSPPPLRVQSTTQKAASSTSDSVVVVTPAESVHETPESNDAWKAEYETQVATWRAQSSEARLKAEKERERWEALRAAERDENAHRKAVTTDDEQTTNHPQRGARWETVANAATTPGAESSRAGSLAPADSTERVTGVSDRLFSVHSATTKIPIGLPGSHSNSDAGDESQKWEHIQSSVTSSLPSMSYPEQIETPPPSRQHLVPQPVPLNATLAVFDSSLSTRTRVKAFFSSLAINMLLPFVNGVMLGFGEIFAKNVVLGWFGWKPSAPGSVVTTVGIGTSAKTLWGRTH